MKLSYKHTLFACFIGYITQAVVNNFAPLLFLIFHEELNISLPAITALVSVNFLIQLAVDFISPFFIDKIGYKNSIITAHFFSSAGLLMMGILPTLFSPFPALLLSVTVYAIGGGIIEVLISPIAESCPTKNKASVMSLLHSFYCWGTMGVVIISTLFLYLFGKDSWHILSCLWAALPLLNMLYFSLVPVNHLTEKKEAMSVKALFTNKTFIIFIFIMIAAGASEQAMSQWASFFTESALGVSKATGDLLGICMFALMMGLARVFHSKFSDKIDIRKALIVSGSINALSYIGVALSPSPSLSLVFCALTGLSSGVLWPGVFSLAAESFPNGGTLMFAYMALAGDLGCASGPGLTGFISSLFNDNLNTGLLSATVFPVILITFSYLLKQPARHYSALSASLRKIFLELNNKNR